MAVVNRHPHNRRYARKVVPLFGPLSTSMRTQLTAANIRAAWMYLNRQ